MRARRADPQTLQQRIQRAENRRSLRRALSAETSSALVPVIRTKAIVDCATGAVLRGPTAERASWVDPDDHSPQTRTPRLVTGYRQSTVIQRLARISESRSALLAREHVQAAHRYLGDFELACGKTGSQLDPSGVRSQHTHRLGFDPEAAQARARWVCARASVGEAGSAVLYAVVVANQDVKRYAAGASPPLDPKVAMGLLVAALTRLVEHYGRKALAQDPDPFR